MVDMTVMMTVQGAGGVNFFLAGKLRSCRFAQTVSIFLAITAVLIIFSSSFFPAAL
jgi:hypothetical protein